MRARRPLPVIWMPARLGVWAITRRSAPHAASTIPSSWSGDSGGAGGLAAARAACASASIVTNPRYHNGPSGSDRIDAGLSSAVVIAAATRRLISSSGSLAYSALIPPCTNKVPPIFTTAGLRVAHLPSSPEGFQASLCSTQPSGCSANQAARTCSAVAVEISDGDDALRLSSECRRGHDAAQRRKRDCGDAGHALEARHTWALRHAANVAPLGAIGNDVHFALF